MKIDKFDKLDESDVHIDKLLPFLNSLRLEEIAFSVDPYVRVCFLCRIKYLGNVA